MIRLRSDVQWRKDGDLPGYLFAGSTGSIYGLNAAAAALLEALSDDPDQDRLVRVLTDTFDVDRLEAEQDVLAFVSALREHGLVA